MAIDEQVKDVQVKKGPVNWRSYSFLRELARIKQENEIIDRGSRIDYNRLHRQFYVQTYI